MIEKMTEGGQLSWRRPCYAAIIETIIFIPIAISHPDTVFFVAIFLVIPALLVASIVLIVLFVRSVLGLGRVHPLSILATLAILWVIPTSLIFYERKHPFALHETARWLAASNVYKAKSLYSRPPTVSLDISNGMERDLPGWRTRQSTWSLIRQILSQQQLRATEQTNSTVSPVKCAPYSVWKATGTPLFSTQIKIGAIAIRTRDVQMVHPDKTHLSETDLPNPDCL